MSILNGFPEPIFGAGTFLGANDGLGCKTSIFGAMIVPERECLEPHSFPERRVVGLLSFAQKKTHPQDLGGPIRANRFADSRESLDSRESSQGSRSEPLFSEVNKRGRPSKWPPECLPSKFADFECAFSL